MVPAFEAVVRLDGQIPSDKAALQVLLNKKHVAGYGSVKVRDKYLSKVLVALLLIQ